MSQENKTVTSTENPIQRQTVQTSRKQPANEIDYFELALLLLDNLHYIVLFFLIGALIFNVYAYLNIHPTYESTSSIYIVNASGGTVVDLTDLNIGASLKNDYKELIMSYPVLDRVSKKLGLGWSTGQMSGAIRVTNPTDTRILKLTATAEEPELAMNIANALAEVAVEYLPETMSTEAPNIAQKGRLPRAMSNPNYSKYTMTGGILGALLCCAWFVLKMFLDETIRTPEDMEKYFGAAPLTTIPYVGALEQDAQNHRSRHRRHHRRHRDRT